MKKHKGYFYTIKCVEIAERNNQTALKKFAWFIRNANGEELESSLGRDPKDFETMWYDKAEAEYDCREAISDYYR